MAKVFICEYAETAVGTLAPLEPVLANQVVAIGATSVQSAAFNAKTKFVRIAADAVCSVAFGNNPTADANSKRIAANVPGEIFGVRPGDKLAVITNT